MTPAAEILAAEIGRSARFPSRASWRWRSTIPPRLLPPPARSLRQAGDFYTAEQIQPVFGILMAARIRQLYRAMGEPADFAVVELGAGRGEMADAFAEWRYVRSISIPANCPQRFRGVVFSNEFFDALPVDVAVFREARSAGNVSLSRRPLRLARGWRRSSRRSRRLPARYFPAPEEGRWYEVNLAALAWLDRIAGALQPDTSSPSITATRAPKPSVFPPAR